MWRNIFTILLVVVGGHFAASLAMAGPGAWDTAYREFEGFGRNEAVFLSVSVTWTPSVAAARTSMARWRSDATVRDIQEATEQASPGAISVEHETFDVMDPERSFADEHLIVTSLVTEPNLTYRLTTMMVRNGQVIYVFDGMVLGDATITRPYTEMYATHSVIVERIQDADHIRDLLPNVADLPYPMREVRTEVEPAISSEVSSL